jgi:hypothetical protein
MLEYVFFDPRPYRRFLDFLQQRGVAVETAAPDDAFGIDSLEVRIPEDLDDALAEAIEARYDELMAWNQELVDAEGGSGTDDYHAAGVVVNLQDGRTVYADVDPHLLARVMEELTPEELGQIVNAIVDAVEHPDTRTFCQRMRDGDGT